MKFSNKFLISLASGLLLLSACSDEVDNKGKAIDDVYVSFYITMGYSDGMSRSGTTTDGGSESEELEGKDKECTIETVNLIFCEVQDETDPDPSQDKYLYHLSETLPTPIVSRKDENTEISIKITEPKSFLNLIAHKKLRLYLVANKTMVFYDIDPSTATFSYDVSREELGKCGKNGKILPLINAQASGLLDLSEKSADDIYEILRKAADNTLNISDENSGIGSVGVITLERAVARIDFRGHTVNGQISHLYKLGKEDGDPDVELSLKFIKVLNISSSAYLFKHTVQGDNFSANYLETNKVNLFGNERGGVSGNYNWVVDTDWGETNSKADALSSVAMESKVAKLCNTSITHSHSNDGRDGHPMFYVPENTLPSVGFMTPEKLSKYATGLEFTFKLADIDTENLPTGLEMVGDKVRITMADKKWMDVEYDEAVEGYALKYTYYLEHNVPNDWNGSDLQPMHYGVVRNNVYDIMVEEVNNLPDPENPLKVNVRIKPWDYEPAIVTW